MRDLEGLFVSFLQSCRSLRELKKVHSLVIQHCLSQSNFLVTKMVDMCDRWEDMYYANLLFKQVGQPNVYLFNAMIRAFTHNAFHFLTVVTYNQIMRFTDEGNNKRVLPNKFTFPFVLKSCVELDSCDLGKQFHAHLCKFGPISHTVTDNALLCMYGKLDSITDARRVFDEMPQKDFMTWNSLISAYAKIGLMKKAKATFNSMPCKTVVSWTAMISGYSSIGSFTEALHMFRCMQLAGVEPDGVTMLSVLPSCAKLGSLEVGKWIHMYCDRNGMLRNTSICNALMEMYSKCGNVDQARQLFDKMNNRDVISWSTMLVALANHGNVVEADRLFEKMKQAKIEPNAITFLALLSACSHAGLWRKGLAYFESMKHEHHLEPSVEHYGALVDLLGRVGLLKQALDVIEMMPIKPDAEIWGTLLGSCRTHGDLEIAATAMERLLELEPDEAGNLVLLGNIYARLGKWKCVARLRTFIRSKTMKKIPGCSLIEIDNNVQEFASGDSSKLCSQELDQLLQQMKLHLVKSNNANETVMAECC